VSGRRPQRLAEEMREEVAAMVGRLKDPRIGFVTVTRVSLASDLSQARVYVGVLGGEADRQRTLEGLQNAAGYLRGEVGRRLHLRHAPQILFEYDRGLDAADRVAQLLEEIKTDEKDGD
jgi:ribosome-binding factor A